MPDSPLIPAKTLFQWQQIGAPVSLIDCRASLTDSNAGRQAWEAGHIEGACWLDLHSELSSPGAGGGRFPLPSIEAFVESLQAKGVNPNAPIVVMDDCGGRLAAARCWWMLSCWLGRPRIYVLDGGLEAWCKAGGGLVTVTSTSHGNGKATDWSGVPLEEHLDHVANAPDVEQGAATSLLLDGRVLERYLGEEEPLDSAAGHIPGALCRPASTNLDELGCFKEPAELRSELPQAVGIISYCGGGISACHNILAYRVAGLPLPKLYPGSWSDWISDPNRPVAVGPAD